jgi:carboxyl-terminal processing protease
MLINEHTTSGGEIVAGFAGDHNLATLVGSRTKGTLLAFSTFPVGGGYQLTIPVANYLTWEGKSYERTGVHPSVSVPFSPAAALEGQDNQLEAALELSSSL